jgi:hypothetical protein
MDGTPAELTAQERALRDLLRAWTVLFAAGGLSFAMTPERTLRNLNRLPGANLPVGEERFWNALAVSLMATLTTLCAFASADVRGRRHLVVPVLVSKAASSGMFLARFAARPRAAYLAGAACDGAILVATLRRYLAAAP